MAAACSGGSTSASSGVATTPTPVKPPLARPRNVTDAMAISQKTGSVGRDKRAILGRAVYRRAGRPGECAGSKPEWLRMSRQCYF